MKQPIETDFKIETLDAAVVVTFSPTKSYYTFYRLADPKDIERFGPVMPEPDNIRHAGPTADTGDYASDAVLHMAHRLALKAAKA
jgi:hypothetical protein